MNLLRMIARMAHTPAAIKAILKDIDSADARWKPTSGAWSILEIVNHLADEDRDDFRLRLMSTLDDPSRPWPKNDPEAWARERKYNTRDLDESLKRFAAERRKSLRFLAALQKPKWKTAYIHPKIGPVTAGELMVSWQAHDALHIRQIAKRLFELAERDGAKDGFTTRYAGEWKA